MEKEKICTTCGHELVPDPLSDCGELQCSNPLCPGKGSPDGLELYSTKDLIDELRKRSTVFVCAMRPKVRRGYDWVRCYGGRLDRTIFLLEMAKRDLLEDSNPNKSQTPNNGGDSRDNEDYDDTDESVDLGPDSGNG